MGAAQADLHQTMFVLWSDAMQNVDEDLIADSWLLKTTKPRNAGL
jgi:hypothetical protein